MKDREVLVAPVTTRAVFSASNPTVTLLTVFPFESAMRFNLSCMCSIKVSMLYCPISSLTLCVTPSITAVTVLFAAVTLNACVVSTPIAAPVRTAGLEICPLTVGILSTRDNAASVSIATSASAPVVLKPNRFPAKVPAAVKTGGSAPSFFACILMLEASPVVPLLKVKTPPPYSTTIPDLLLA